MAGWASRREPWATGGLSTRLARVEEVMLENGLLRMTPQGFDAFLAAVSGPPAPVAPMVEILRRAPPWGGVKD